MEILFAEYLEETMAIVMVVIVAAIGVIGWIKEEKENKKNFDDAYPVGEFFFTAVKDQKFPYGKWEYRGTDQDGVHVFERIK